MQKTIDSNQETRFAFGENWAHFLKHLNEERILEAIASLKEKLEIEDLSGKIFLDIGSGSGLFSLAAHRLGASVFSFDFDRNSVECTRYLKEHYGNKDFSWEIEQGSVLNKAFLEKFQKVDIVYSWGVLHHTGHMYTAFENVSSLVKDGGKLFISIYNDQGKTSSFWKLIKKKFNDSNDFSKKILLGLCVIRLWGATFIKDLLKSGNPLYSWIHYGKKNRGMSAWHDVVDWVGGYPFEVAKPEEVFNFFKAKDFQLEKIQTCAGGIGCNEFVFKKGVFFQTKDLLDDVAKKTY